MASKFSKLPLWLMLLLALIIGVLSMALIILTVAAMTGLEGFASLIMLILLILTVIIWPLKYKERASFKGVAGVSIIFLAFMGGILDQAGNKVMNAPVEQCYCEKGEELKRVLTHISRGGKSSTSNEFYCENPISKKSTSVSTFGIIGIRMFEYLILGILLYFMQHIIWKAFYSNIEKDKKDDDGENGGYTVFQDEELIISKGNNSFTRIIRINLKKK